MGLGGVAIAVLPSMIYPKQPFSDGLGGVAYVISKPKKQKQASTLQELIFIFIDI